MYSVNARDHFNCSPLLFSWPAPQNRCAKRKGGTHLLIYTAQCLYVHPFVTCKTWLSYSLPHTLYIFWILSMYCNRSCLWVYGCVCGSVTMITRNCMHWSSPNWLCRERISSWLNFGHPVPPKRGICSGAKMFGSALLQPACSVCVSSEHFFSSELAS